MYALLIAAALTSNPAVAADPKPVNVKVVVTDQAGVPVATAVVRHPQEADKHKVNTFDGSWQADTLYLPDGSELRFLKGDLLELEITAPGYVPAHVSYEVRARKNVVPITLEPMAMPRFEDDTDIVVGFQHDQLLDR